MSNATTFTSWMVPMLLMGLTGAGAGPVFAEPYQVIDVTNGGTITGIAVWTGEVPELPPIEVGADQHICGDERPSQALRVNSNTNGVQYVLVYLERVEKGKAPADQYPLQILGCQFKEHIFPFVRSQTMSIVNYDKVPHNSHFLNAKHGSPLNLLMPVASQYIDHKLLQIPGTDEKGVMRLRCDIHHNMNAYWAGFDHPYFAVTDVDGKFVISEVPAGKYTLMAWHEGYKIIREETGRPIYDRPHIRQQEIEVKPKETVDVSFEFPARKVHIDY